MEEGFQFQQQPPVVGGKAPSIPVDEAYYSGVYAGLSFRSLLTSGSFETAAETLAPHKMSKTEPLYIFDDGVATVAPQYNFFSEATSSSFRQQLPSILPFELPHKTAAVDSQMLNPRVKTAPHGKQRWRRRKERLSDKTRCLQKFLPLDKKMDMATVLEEAYNYIKFLQAQVSVLQSMPCESSAATNYGVTWYISGGDLGKLSRQQLLQVVMNSSLAQTHMYSKGCCVYSVEQLALLKKNAEKETLRHQMMLQSSNPNFFLP